MYQDMPYVVHFQEHFFLYRLYLTFPNIVVLVLKLSLTIPFHFFFKYMMPCTSILVLFHEMIKKKSDECTWRCNNLYNEVGLLEILLKICVAFLVWEDSLSYLQRKCTSSWAVLVELLHPPQTCHSWKAFTAKCVHQAVLLFLLTVLIRDGRRFVAFQPWCIISYIYFILASAVL